MGPSCTGLSARALAALALLLALAPTAWAHPTAPALYPVSPEHAALYALVAIVTLIAASGGVGGGPVLVPLYLMLGQFSNTAAVALSNCSIFAASIANVLVVVPRRRHPTRDRPLVAWDLIMLLQPTTSIGAMWGAYINKVIPVWIAQLLLAVMLTSLSWRISNRAMFIYRKETAAKAIADAMAAAEAKAAQEACAADSPPPAAAGPVEARKGGSGDGKDGGQDGGEAEADATASVHAAEDACSEDKRQAGCSVGGAPAAHGALRQNSLLSWEPSVLPTLEVDMAAAANGTAAWVQQQAAGDPGAADRGCAGRQSDSVRAGRSSKSRPSSASPQLQQPPRPASPRGAAPAAAAAAPAAEAAPSGAAAPEAESKLAYAPPHERPEGDSDPDVGGGSVHGVPVPSNAGSTDGSSSGQGSGGKDACVPAPEMAEARLTADLQDVLCAEARQLPPWHAAGLLLMCATVLLTSLFSKRQACGGWQFWAIQAAAVPVLLGLSVAARRDVLSKARVKKAAQVDWEGEMRWTRSNTLLYPAISTLAGVVAGVFGLGGGIVFTPLMLELGTHPQVTAATTQTMLLFTTGASTVVFAQMGDIPWDFAGVIMAIAFFSTLAGQLAVDRIIRRSGRGSTVVIVLAAFFSCACLLSFYVAARSIVAFALSPDHALRARGVCG